MATFSQRAGLTPVRTAIQIESLDDPTRVALWNVLDIVRDELYKRYDDETVEAAFGLLWMEYFEQERDRYQDSGDVWGAIKARVKSGQWYQALDVTEEVAKYFEKFKDLEHYAELTRELVNKTFEKFLVGYRFVGSEIAQITSAVEVEAIEKALVDTSGFAGAQHHLSNALQLLSDRATPDYANSVKEALSAVESIGDSVTGKKTLGSALDALGNHGIKVHGGQLAAWKSMYGWASDAGGIRHSSQTIPNVDQATAMYTLVTASAFVSLVIEAMRKVGTKRNER